MRRALNPNSIGTSGQKLESWPLILPYARIVSLKGMDHSHSIYARIIITIHILKNQIKKHNLLQKEKFPLEKYLETFSNLNLTKYNISSKALTKEVFPIIMLNFQTSILFSVTQFY